MARNSSPSRRASRAPALLDEGAAIAAVEHFPLDPLFEDASTSPEKMGGLAAAVAGEDIEGISLCRSYMTESHGGGSLEPVPGFVSAPAMTAFVSQVSARQMPAPGSVLDDADWLPESVIGPDMRRPVPGTTSLPWRCIARLDTLYESGRTGRGTGWFIGGQTLVTAAHCLFSQEAGRARSIIVSPGYDRGITPFGRFTAKGSFFNPDWGRSFDPVLDFALLYIERNPGTGWFGFAAAADEQLQRVLVNVAGYPNDRVDTQWFDGGRLASADRFFLYHSIDTAEGQSGAPIFWSDRDQRIGLGIHTYGVGRGLPSNRARRITPELFELFQARSR